MRRRGFITSVIGLFVAPKVLPPAAPAALEFSIKSTPIIVPVRRLRAEWSMEAAAELERLHGIGIEDSLKDFDWQIPVFDPTAGRDCVEC